ncbi:MAG: hypothetical protein WAT93_13690 [Pontixanthobacter sp.]
MSKALAMMKVGTSLGPIYPQSIEDAYRLSKMAFTAGMLKPQRVSGFGDNAVYEEAEAVLARGTMIIMQGMELGIPPMQAVQLLAMINGRITAHSEAVPGMLLAHGFKIKEEWSGSPMSDDWTCTITITRPNGEGFIGSFSVTKAKRAGLWDQSPTKRGYGGKEKPNDAAWFRYPDRMLKARALGFAAKDGAADVLKGIQVREEAEDQVRVANMRDVTPVKTASVIPDVPDVPDLPDVPDVPDIPSIEDHRSGDTIVDVSGLLSRIEEDVIAAGNDPEARAEIAEMYSDVVERLPEDARGRAYRMLEAEL